jgi:hypothetical protein
MSPGGITKQLASDWLKLYLQTKESAYFLQLPTPESSHTLTPTPTPDSTSTNFLTPTPTPDSNQKPPTPRLRLPTLTPTPKPCKQGAVCNLLCSQLTNQGGNLKHAHILNVFHCMKSQTETCFC